MVRECVTKCFDNRQSVSASHFLLSFPLGNTMSVNRSTVQCESDQQCNRLRFRRRAQVSGIVSVEWSLDWFARCGGHSRAVLVRRVSLLVISPPHHCRISPFRLSLSLTLFFFCTFLPSTYLLVQPVSVVRYCACECRRAHLGHRRSRRTYNLICCWLTWSAPGGHRTARN